MATRKRIGLVLGALLALGACAINPSPKPPWPTYTVTADIAGVDGAALDLRVALVVDDARPTNCLVTPPLHAVCSTTGPAPFGSTFAVTAPAGYRSPAPVRVLLDPRAPRTQLGTITLARAFEQRHGVVRHEGKAWVDDDGPFYPFGATFFYAYDGLTVDEARFRATCLYFSTHHVQFIRILGQVAWPQTADPPFVNGHAIFIRPSDADYVARLGRLIDIAYDEYGLRSELSIYGEWPLWTDPPGWTPVDTAARIREVVSAGRFHKLHSIELTNEGHIGQCDEEGFCRQDEPTMFAMGDQLKWLGLPMVPTNSEQAQAIAWVGSGHGFTHATVRFERGNGDFDWRFPRQPSEWGGLPFAYDNNEPQGPASSLARTSDPLRLAMARVISILRGGGSYVLHNGAGINGFEDPSRGRTANVWEMPGIDAIMDAVGRVHELLPDIEGWRPTSQSGTNAGAGQVLTSDAIWSDRKSDGSFPDHGVSRNYGVTAPDGRFVQAPIGVLNFANFTAQAPCHAKAFNPVTRELIDEVTLEQGQVWRLPGDPETNTAYVIVGERR